MESLIIRKFGKDIAGVILGYLPYTPLVQVYKTFGVNINFIRQESEYWGASTPYYKDQYIAVDTVGCKELFWWICELRAWKNVYSGGRREILWKMESVHEELKNMNF